MRLTSDGLRLLQRNAARLASKKLVERLAGLAIMHARDKHDMARSQTKRTTQDKE